MNYNYLTLKLVIIWLGLDVICGSSEHDTNYRHINWHVGLLQGPSVSCGYIRINISRILLYGDT